MIATILSIIFVLLEIKNKIYCNFDCCSSWVRKLNSHSRSRICNVDASVKSDEEKICTTERATYKRLKKNWQAS